MPADLTNPKPTIINIEVRQGQTFVFIHTVLGDDGQPEDITDWIVESKVRNLYSNATNTGEEILYDLEPEYLGDPASGETKGKFHCSFDIPVDAPIGKFYWDWFVTNAEGIRSPIYVGKFTILPGAAPQEAP